MSNLEVLVNQLAEKAIELGRCEESEFWMVLPRAREDMNHARYSLMEEINILLDRINQLERQIVALGSKPIS